MKEGPVLGVQCMAMDVYGYILALRTGTPTFKLKEVSK